MKDEIVFNMNSYIKVKITEVGEKMLKKGYGNTETYDNLIRGYIKNLYIKDNEGYINIQMWEFIRIFGNQFYMGNNELPCGMNIKICVD